MNADQENQFTKDFVVTDDGAVTFRCETSVDDWPWLSLHPATNTVVQMVNYYSLTGVSAARENHDPEKWTALTSFQWQTFAMGADAHHATHGVADPKPTDDNIDYAATLFDAHGALVYRVGGTGVVFQNRDFKSWREKSKSRIMALPEPKGFQFVTPEEAGVATAVECFVGRIGEGEALYVDALITEETGFSPAHPYHDGSGDHVNSTHICDAAEQAAHLIRHRFGKHGYPNGGKVAFNRYVELNRPFRIVLVSDPAVLDQMQFRFEQGGRPCVDLTFSYDA